MIQCPTFFCRIRSFMRAFFEPNNFIASRLSVGWNSACNWLRRNEGFESPTEDTLAPDLSRFVMLGVNGSSFGVPYKLPSSPEKCTLEPLKSAGPPDLSVQKIKLPIKHHAFTRLYMKLDVTHTIPMHIASIQFIIHGQTNGIRNDLEQHLFIGTYSGKLPFPYCLYNTIM